MNVFLVAKHNIMVSVDNDAALAYCQKLQAFPRGSFIEFACKKFKPHPTLVEVAVRLVSDSG